MVTVDTNYKNSSINTAQLFTPRFKGGAISTPTNPTGQNGAGANYAQFDTYRSPVVKNGTVGNNLDFMV